MKINRTQLAAIASAVILIALVVLYTVGGEAAKDFSERLEGMLTLTFLAFIGEAAKSRLVGK